MEQEGVSPACQSAAHRLLLAQRVEEGGQNRCRGLIGFLIDASDSVIISPGAEICDIQNSICGPSSVVEQKTPPRIFSCSNTKDGVIDERVTGIATQSAVEPKKQMTKQYYYYSTI